MTLVLISNGSTSSKGSIIPTLQIIPTVLRKCSGTNLHGAFFHIVRVEWVDRDNDTESGVGRIFRVRRDRPACRRVHGKAGVFSEQNLARLEARAL